MSLRTSVQDGRQVGRSQTSAMGNDTSMLSMLMRVTETQSAHHSLTLQVGCGGARISEEQARFVSSSAIASNNPANCRWRPQAF